MNLFCLLKSSITICYLLMHLTVEITLLNISLSVVCLWTFAVYRASTGPEQGSISTKGKICFHYRVPRWWKQNFPCEKYYTVNLDKIFFDFVHFHDVKMIIQFDLIDWSLIGSQGSREIMNRMAIIPCPNTITTLNGGWYALFTTNPFENSTTRIAIIKKAIFYGYSVVLVKIVWKISPLAHC